MTRYEFALLGDPVEHSRSPLIHTTLLDLAGLEGDYTTITADERALADAVAGLRSGRWHGLNVTMPLKNAAAGMADTLTPMADKSGSVNTLVMAGESVAGHTTDATAFRALVDDGRFGEDPVLLVLGAGATAAVALAALADHRTVYVSARRPEAGDSITRRLGGEPVPWGTAVAGAVLINTTPLGMRGESLPGGLLEVSAGLIDLPYGDATTTAVARATSAGLVVADGHEFLLRQALDSFLLWTGVEPEFGRVDQALRKALRGLR